MVLVIVSVMVAILIINVLEVKLTPQLAFLGCITKKKNLIGLFKSIGTDIPWLHITKNLIENNKSTISPTIF
jgi:hypothetical protein